MPTNTIKGCDVASAARNGSTTSSAHTKLVSRPVHLALVMKKDPFGWAIGKGTDDLPVRVKQVKRRRFTAGTSNETIFPGNTGWAGVHRPCQTITKTTSLFLF